MKTLIVVPDDRYASDAILSLPPDSDTRLVQTGPKAEKLPGYEVTKNQHEFFIRCAKNDPAFRFRTFILLAGEKYVYEQGKKPAKRTVRHRKPTKRIVSVLRKAIARVENRQIH